MPCCSSLVTKSWSQKSQGPLVTYVHVVKEAEWKDLALRYGTWIASKNVGRLILGRQLKLGLV